MKTARLFLCLLMIGHAVNADPPMSAAEFDRYTLGKTFYYGSDGRAYGAEEYLSNRRVRWTFLDGQCVDGEWYEEDGHICFAYENRIEPQCWTFQASGAGLAAQFENDPDPLILYEVQQTAEPLHCLGPKVGV